ncbi:hypothetical protein MKW94_026828 [Papaver nudicaule]|uniref:RING-type E3 ubiquitin transferase n=1 Tax=Papaver nudicaule TaxID=74823 RepID=A0AA41W0A3_PAPNU|nr:hypothetical protein [Papaver nudicaule]
MDDSCAVCAESLEWVAYGPCGHREVCSTCVSRLRFICEDKRCCICKTESDVVFITKALGDYTKVISDFSVFPSDPKEGKVGSYWYHEDMGAYFDDSDHYRMIQAMCRLSCNVCDNAEERTGGPHKKKAKAKFRNIDQLKNHFYHQHKLFMCSLCLEGRKIFMCEQKLYTRAQLNQHINTGDSEVDGTESERGGFMGHPICEFCKKPFYGDNELYTHMSTEHFTCHICKRLHPAQFDYFKNYDDLEIHFRQQHCLCEDDACLAKKFIVFQSESEMKRHIAIEHGGNMSRAKRNSALQIPTSFRYRLRSNEQDFRRGRGRGRGSHSDSSADQLAVAIQASLESANSDSSTARDITSSAQATRDLGETSEIGDIIPPMESLFANPELSRYYQAVSQTTRNGTLEGSAFPPLAGVSSTVQQNSSEQGGRNTMASRLRHTGHVGVINPGQPQPVRKGHGTWVFPSSPSSSSATSLRSNVPFSSASSSQPKPASSNVPPSYGSSIQARSVTIPGPASANSGSPWISSNNKSMVPQPKPATSNVPPPSYGTSTQAKSDTIPGLPSANSGSPWSSSNTKSRVTHSTSAPNLVERGGSSDSHLSDYPPVMAPRKNNGVATSKQHVSRLEDEFPPVTATVKNKVPISKEPLEKVEDVQTANKSLVERIRSALDNDENKYSIFKDISGEFRQGMIGPGEYLNYVQQFGLTHLVLELARLCPDTQKQRELIENYNAFVIRSRATSNNSHNGKGKKKLAEEPDNSLADNVISSVRKLHANYKPSEEEDVEVLSKDGYRTSKGKSVAEDILGSSSANPKPLDYSGVGVPKNSGVGRGGASKEKKKKIPKFQRVRLGEAASLDPHPEPEEDTPDSSDGVVVRGAWRNGGGQKLVALTQRGTPK